MKRRLLQFCFVITLLVTLGTAWLWVRRYWIIYTMEFERSALDHSEWVETFGWIGMRRRLVVCACSDRRTQHRVGAQAPRFELRLESDAFVLNDLAPHGTVWEKIGFKHVSQSTPTYTGHVISLPSWLIVGCCALATAAAGWPLWSMRRRRSRVLRGLCPTCGYDLRGAEHERCPECGQVVVGAAARV